MARVRSQPSRLWLLPSALAIALVAGEHMRTVAAWPLVAYGSQGAEYIEHVQRARAVWHTAGHGFLWRVLALPADLHTLDDAYPPLLHLLAALWSRIVGDGVEAAVHMNLVFLAVLALGAAALARGMQRELGGKGEALTRVMRSSGGSSDSATLALVAALAVAAPAVFGAARRYYYDLPMTAAVTVAFAALLVAHRSGRGALLAALASAAALMFKWTAGFYLLPLWVMAGVRALAGWRSSRDPRALLTLAAGGALTVALCGPLLLNSGALMNPLARAAGVLGWTLEGPHGVTGSLDYALIQAHSPTAAVGRGVSLTLGAAQGLAWYGDSLARCVLGVGLVAALLARLPAGGLARVACAVDRGVPGHRSVGLPRVGHLHTG